MTRLREEFDADREHPLYSEGQTGTRSHEIICSECGRHHFCDTLEYERITRAFEANRDNQFICENCFETDDELGHLAS